MKPTFHWDSTITFYYILVPLKMSTVICNAAYPRVVLKLPVVSWGNNSQVIRLRHVGHWRRKTGCCRWVWRRRRIRQQFFSTLFGFIGEENLNGFLQKGVKVLERCSGHNFWATYRTCRFPASVCRICGGFGLLLPLVDALEAEGVAALEAGGFDEELVADGALEVGLAQFDHRFTLKQK